MKRILCLAALGFTLQAYAADDSTTKKAELERQVLIFTAKEARLKEDIDIAQRAVYEAQRALEWYKRTADPAVLAAVEKLRREALARIAAEEYEAILASRKSR